MLNLLKRLLTLLIVVPLGGIIIGMMAGPWTGLMTMLVTVSGIRWIDRTAQANRDQKLTLPAVHISNPSQSDQAFNLAPEESSSQAPVVEARFQVDSMEMREITIEQTGVQEKVPVLQRHPGHKALRASSSEDTIKEDGHRPGPEQRNSRHIRDRGHHSMSVQSKLRRAHLETNMTQ